MRGLSGFLGGVVAVLAFHGALALAKPQAQSQLISESRRGDTCMMVAGGSTTIDSDNSGANLSGALEQWSRYWLQCDADAYLAQGTLTGAVTDAGDIWLPAGGILEVYTDATNIYLSVLNKTDATADCHYVECR
jgi:hypothetical protein